MKTCNLTQSHTRNDIINCRIHGFSFRDFEDEDDIQDMISPYSLDQFLISNTPWMQKRVKKLKKSKDSQIVVSRQFDLLENPRLSFPSRRKVEFIEDLGITVGCNSPSRSTVEITRMLMNQRD